MFANKRQHYEQPESISNTCAVEKVDSNVILDSPDMCDNDIQTNQNVVECDDERVVLPNLIANLKLDVDENKKIQKQLKKANTSLAHELKECKSFLAETSKTLGESKSIRDSCLIALQNKQTGLETYKTINNHTVTMTNLNVFCKMRSRLRKMARWTIALSQFGAASYPIVVTDSKMLLLLVVSDIGVLRNFLFRRFAAMDEIERRREGWWSVAARLGDKGSDVADFRTKQGSKELASDASLGEKYYSRIVSDKGNDQGLENQSNTSGDKSSRSRNECYDKSTSGDDTDIRPSYDTTRIVEVPYTAEYNVFVVDTQHSKQPECIINTCIVEKVNKCDDERVVLANLIANLKLDVDENKKIQKQLKKANTSLAHELKECKSILVETSRILGESNSIRDSYLIALQNKQTELETYKTLNDRTVDYDKLEHKLNETLGLLAQKEIDIKEGLKLKAYEISVVKEKHDELVKQSLLTKSHYEGLVKEKTKVITDLKLKEEKDIDKMISMEKQLKFLNEIVYKRNQSIQTIHMLAPKGPTFNGRPTFANPMYLKKAQSEKPCLYEIPYDQSDPANRLVPDREETLTLEKESRSKLNKDLVRPYDYTKLNSLYEIFKPASQEYNEQLAHANE
ncbi:hypothetical protein Tco_0712483, partial [Tanacetum coccineum]